MADMNQAPVEGQKNKHPKYHPVRMQKIPSHLEGAAELEKLCFSNPWSAKSMELLTNEGIGVGYLCLTPAAPNSEPMVTAYGGMLITVDEGQITNIAVHPDHRRKGLGSAILRTLIRHAKDAKLESISLEVRVSNTAAIKLYESFGFEQVGKRPRFYEKPTEDAYVMVCKIK